MWCIFETQCNCQERPIDITNLYLRLLHAQLNLLRYQRHLLGRECHVI